MSQLRLRRRTRKNGSPRVKWALATVAPWAMSFGLLVSFTASAGQNGALDNAPLSTVPRLAPALFSELEEGPSMLVAASAFRLPGLSLSSAIQQARLSFDEPERRIVIDPRQPREDMKKTADAFPEVDRSAKGDPLPGLRPTLSSQRPRGELEHVVFGDNQPKLISGGFSLEAVRESEMTEPPVGFEPLPFDQGLTDPALSDSSPSSLRPIITSPRQAELHLESIDGSSPSVPRASAQSSSTPAVNYSVATLPAPASSAMGSVATPSLVSRGSAAASSLARKADLGPREIYTGLIIPDNMAKEQRCLAEAIYFEARSESDEGRAAVAQVVLNRVKSGLYPDSVCGTVYQNRNRYLACQFTFACEGKSLRITEPEPWRAAVRIAREVYEGTTYLAEVGASTHYHADYVRPYWAKKLKKMDVIGRHVFYKLRPGQT